MVSQIKTSTSSKNNSQKPLVATSRRQRPIFPIPRILFFHDWRRRRRGPAPTVTRQQRTAEESEYHSFRRGNSHSKRWCTHSFRPSDFYKKNKEAHNRKGGTPSLRRRHQVFKLFKQTDCPKEQALYSKETKLGQTNPLPSEPFFTSSACHFNFSHHIPLPVSQPVHGERKTFVL